MSEQSEYEEMKCIEDEAWFVGYSRSCIYRI